MNEIQPLEVGHSIRSLTVQDLINRVDRIREVQAKVMKDGVDYGLIPGCGDKPTLLKPGAETLLLAFEMAALPDQLTVADLGDSDEVRYRVVVPIVHVPTGRLCGNGVGEASSMEEKYKWRKAVCDAEYDATDPDMRRLKYYRDGGTAKQVRTNKADVANTILKMAKKRGMVDGALTAVAASRVFSQDFDELPEEMRGEERPTKKATVKAAPSTEPCAPNYGPDAGKPLSQIEDKHLEMYLEGSERAITDEKKARFKVANEKMRDAIMTEIGKRQVVQVMGDGDRVENDADNEANNAGDRYLHLLNASQSVKECSGVLNDLIVDKVLSDKDRQLLKEWGTKRLNELKK